MPESPPWVPEVKISTDGMKAFAVLPEPKECSPSVEAVLAALSGAGVVAGISLPAVQEALTLEKWGQRVLVAEGTPPADGRDSSVDYLFRKGAVQRPQELDDGRVDFKNFDLIANVRKDQVLAARVPSQPGTDGLTVRGEPVQCRASRELPLPAGRNVTRADSDTRLVATLDGQALADKNGIVHVLPVFEVRGDVGMETGNIRFVGSVVIYGDVAPGFSIEAAGNIEVRGFVSGDDIMAQNDIIVSKGIQGRGKGKVRAGGNVTALFVENACVDSGGVVRVRDAIMHSSISATSKVLVSGGKGVIVGGLIRAGEEVAARIIGSRVATATEIEVGVDPSLRCEHAEVLLRLDDKEIELVQVDQAVRICQSKFERAPSRIDADKKALLLKLIKYRVDLAQEVDSLRQSRDSLEERVTSARRGRVSCTTLYPGVRVTVGGASMQVTDEWYNAVLFLNEAGKVAISSK